MFWMFHSFSANEDKQYNKWKSDKALYIIIIIMYSKGKILYLSLLMLLVVCQKDYQQRAIYLGPNDNVCHLDAVLVDQLYMVINIEGSPAVKTQVWGYTSCSDRGFTDAERIYPNNAFTYIDRQLGNEIRVKQTEKRNYLYSFLHSIVLKATEVDSCTLSKKPCSCQILGDGQVHHFGVSSTNHSPAQIFLNCKYVASTQ